MLPSISTDKVTVIKISQPHKYVISIGNFNYCAALKRWLYKETRVNYLQSRDDNIEHGSERISSICNVLMNNNASKPNKQ